MKLDDKMNDTVSLCEQKLAFVPDYIGTMLGLRVLFISHNNIKQIPDFLTNLPNLEFLYLSSNKIKTIPSSISNLKKLRVLSLGSNKISIIPKEIGDLPNLVSLDISSNNIQEIPAQILNLQKLRFLDAHHNNIVKSVNYLRLLDINKGHIETFNCKHIDQSFKDILFSIMDEHSDIIQSIKSDTILYDRTKEILLDFCQDKTVYAGINITYSELLGTLWKYLQSKSILNHYISLYKSLDDRLLLLCINTNLFRKIEN